MRNRPEARVIRETRSYINMRNCSLLVACFSSLQSALGFYGTYDAYKSILSVIIKDRSATSRFVLATFGILGMQVLTSLLIFIVILYRKSKKAKSKRNLLLPFLFVQVAAMLFYFAHGIFMFTQIGFRWNMILRTFISKISTEIMFGYVVYMYFLELRSYTSLCEPLTYGELQSPVSGQISPENVEASIGVGNYLDTLMSNENIERKH